MPDPVAINKPKGFVRFFREEFTDPLFNSKQSFSRLEAWLWILSHASIEAETLGEFQYTERGLAKIFQWPNPTLRKFIKQLEALGRVEAKSKQKGSTIVVINFDSYSGSVSKKEAESKQTPDLTIITKEIRTKNKITHSRKPKSKPLTPDEVMALALPHSFGPRAKEALEKWAKYKHSLNSPLLKESWEAEIAEFENEPRAFVSAVNFSIRKGYKGLFRDKSFSPVAREDLSIQQRTALQALKELEEEGWSI